MPANSEGESRISASNAAFRMKRLAHQGLCVFAENFGYSFLASWRIALFLQLLCIVPAGYAPVASLSVWHVLMLSTAAGGIIVCLGGKRLSPLYASKPYLLISGLLGSCAMLGIALFVHGFVGTFVFLLGIGAGGVAFSLVTAAWLQRFIAQGLDSVAWNYLVGHVVGTLLFFAVNALFQGGALYLLAAFPLASCLTIKNKLRPDAEKGENEMGHLFEGAEQLRPAPVSYTIARLFVVLVLVCLSFGLLGFQTFGRTATFPAEMFVALVFLDVLVCIFAKVIASFAYASRSLVVFYLAIPLFCVSTLCMLLAASSPAWIACYCAALVGFQLTSFMVVFKIAETYRDRSNNVAPFIGGILVIQHGGQLVGQLMGPLLPYEAAISIAILICMVASALTVMNSSTSFALATPNRQTAKIEAIRKVAQKYHLTSRETDVLELWGMGHTSNYIEQQLYIAKSTVKTHLTHIYQKTGAESKEDLLQLIDKGA